MVYSFYHWQSPMTEQRFTYAGGGLNISAAMVGLFLSNESATVYAVNVGSTYHHFTVLKGWSNIGIVAGGYPGSNPGSGIFMEGHPNWGTDGSNIAAGSTNYHSSNHHESSNRTFYIGNMENVSTSTGVFYQYDTLAAVGPHDGSRTTITRFPMDIPI